MKKCRYYSRIPVLTWFSAEKQVGIWRAAFKMEGIKSIALKFDAEYIKLIKGNVIPILLEEKSVRTGSSLTTFQNLLSLKVSFQCLLKSYQSCLAPTSCKADFYRYLSKWYEEIDQLISLAYNVVDLMNVHLFLFRKTIVFSLKNFMPLIDPLKF